MPPDTTTLSISRTKPSDNTHRKRQSKHTAGSVLAITAGITLALASAATNAIYGWSHSDVLASQITWSAVSIAASAILALGPTTLLKALKARSLAACFLALLAIALCGSYSFSAAIGASAGQRITAQVAQTDTDGTRARLQRAYDLASGDLQSLPASSGTAAELDAKIAALKQTPGANDCAKIDGPVSKRVCPEAAALEVERAKSARREELQATMADASRDLAKLGPAKVANSDASAIAGYLKVAGIELSTDALNRWLALLAVALVELGGGLACALSSVLREPVSEPVSERREEKASTPEQPTALDTPEDAKKAEASPTLTLVTNQPPQKLVVPESFSGRLLQMVSERGGTLYSGHRGLAKALGCSTAHIGNVLRELSAAGQVTVQPTKSGTVIRLAA